LIGRWVGAAFVGGAEDVVRGQAMGLEMMVVDVGVLDRWRERTSERWIDRWIAHYFLFTFESQSTRNVLMGLMALNNPGKWDGCGEGFIKSDGKAGGCCLHTLANQKLVLTHVTYPHMPIQSVGPESSQPKPRKTQRH